MKKDSSPSDELRPEYKRSDFGELVRGKYVERLKKGSNVVVLDPLRHIERLRGSGALDLTRIAEARKPRTTARASR